MEVHKSTCLGPMNEACNARSSSPTTEIVELISDEGELITSFTRDLSLYEEKLKYNLLENSVDGFVLNENLDPPYSRGTVQNSGSSQEHDKLQLTKSNLKSQSERENEIEILGCTLSELEISEEQESTILSERGNKTKTRCLSKEIDSKGDRKEYQKAEKPKKQLRFRQRQFKREKLFIPLCSLDDTSSSMPIQKGFDEMFLSASNLNSEFEDAAEQELARAQEELKRENLKQLRSQFKRMSYQNQKKTSDENSRLSLRNEEPIDVPVMNSIDESLTIDEALTIDEGERLYDSGNFDPEKFDTSTDNLDILVRAFDQGLFDDCTKAHVIERLEDFENLNNLLETQDSFVEEVTSQFDRSRSFEINDDIIEDAKLSIKSNFHEFDIISHLIVENKIASDPDIGYPCFFEYDGIQRSVLDRDIRQNYYRLKHQLFPEKRSEE